jgi:hypothetical protein
MESDWNRGTCCYGNLSDEKTLKRLQLKGIFNNLKKTFNFKGEEKIEHAVLEFFKATEDCQGRTYAE